MSIQIGMTINIHLLFNFILNFFQILLILILMSIIMNLKLLSFMFSWMEWHFRLLIQINGLLFGWFYLYMIGLLLMMLGLCLWWLLFWLAIWLGLLFLPDYLIDLNQKVSLLLRRAWCLSSHSALLYPLYGSLL